MNGLIFPALVAFSASMGVGVNGDNGPRLAPSATYRAADGSILSLTAPRGGATAVIFYSSECPISNYYSPTLNELSNGFDTSRFRLVGVCVDPDLSPDGLRKHAQEYSLSYPVIRDPRGLLAKALGATVTPEAFLIDDSGRVRYQGRIDDQYADRRVKTTTPKTHELRDAIQAVLNGKEVEAASTRAVGCPIPHAVEAQVTYARDVAPILMRSCVECHSKGQIGPFPLETYEQARKRAEDLVAITSERLMPPWRAKPGFGPPMRGDRSLTTDEIGTLAAWADANAPEGDRSQTPERPATSTDWKLGTPDLVVEMPVEFEVPAGGDDIYRCFVIPTNLPSDMYVAGIEYRPGNARVVHHILSYVDTSGEARKKDEAEQGPGYMCFGGPGVEINNDLGGWAPGAEPMFLADGLGRSLPKGSDVIMQVHYHPTGKPETDRSKIGLYFARKPVRQTFHWSYVAPPELHLAAGGKSIEVTAERRLPLDVEAYAVAPHMHMLGTDMTMWAELPDGKRVDLIEIDHWDFAWQNQYYYKTPIFLPKGTVLKLVSHYDNSSDNPHNPRREMPIEVSWGEATTDEMCIGFIGLAKAGQDLTKPGEHDDLREILRQQEKRHRQGLPRGRR